MVHLVTGSVNIPEKYAVAPGLRLCGPDQSPMPLLQGYLKVEQSRDPRGGRPLAGCGARKPGGLPFPTFSPFPGVGRRRRGLLNHPPTVKRYVARTL